MNPTVRWPDKSLPGEIACSPGVLTGLEMAATDGLLAMPRTGLGIGGLLLGRKTGERIEILRSVPISCSHTMGPSFVLTSDEIAATLKMAAPEDADGEVVGWYCSKTREPVALTKHDRCLFDAFCPEPWQLTLLIRPAKGKVTKAAFGRREVYMSGVGHADAFHLGEWMDLAWQELAEYQVTSDAPMPVAMPEPIPTQITPPVTKASLASEDLPPDTPTAVPWRGPLFGTDDSESDARETELQSPWPRRIVIAVVLLVLLAIAAFFTREYWMPRPTVSLLASSDWSGRVYILWNGEALGNQDQASLILEDGGGPPRSIRLDQTRIRAGWSECDCRTGKVTVTLLAGNISDSLILTTRAKNYLPESGISK